MDAEGLADVDPLPPGIPDDEPRPARRLWFWLGFAGFIVIVSALGGLFVVAAQEEPVVEGYRAYAAPPPHIPLTVIGDPADQQPPVTVSSMKEPASTSLLALPGQQAALLLLSALDAAGQDPMTTEVVRTVSTSVYADGSVNSYTTISLLLDSGFSDALGVAANGGVLWYEPPILSLPSVLTPGHVWSAEGLTNAVAPYTVQGTVLDTVQIVEPPGPVSSLQGCRDVQTSTDQQIPGSEGYFTERTTTWCPGWGSVASTDMGTGVVTRLAAADEAAWNDALIPEPASRPAGTLLAFPTTLAKITRAPVPVASGFVVSNDSSQDLVSVTMGPPDPDVPDTSATATWIQHPGGQTLGIAQGNGLTFVTTSLRALLAFDNAGRMRWSASIPDAAVGAPVVLGDVVAVALVDGTLRGFDAASGSPRWTVPLSDVVLEPPVVADGVILAADSAGYVVAVNPGGEVRWEGSLDRVDQPITVLGDGTALFAQATGFLTRLDSTGEEMWTVPLLDGSVLPGGVLRDGVIILPTDGGLLGIDAISGDVTWTQDSIISATLSEDGMLVADRDRVLRVEPDGSIQVVANIAEASGDRPVKLFLVPMGDEWVAVSQGGTVAFLGVKRE